MREIPESEKYGGEGPPGLLDQVVGVFSEPVALFRRLHATPAWKGALGLTLLLSTLMTLVWGWRVDADALFRPAYQENLALSGGETERTIELLGKFLVPGSILLGLVSIFLGTLLFSALYWAIGKATAEKEPPTFVQALCATIVPNLVTLPYLLLLIFICLVKPIGGLTPEKVAPTSLGYFLEAGSAKFQMLFYKLDIFNAAAVIMAFLAGRHLLRLKVLGAAACAAAMALFLVIPVLLTQ